MNVTPLSVIVNEVWGEKGTPERNAMETQLKKDLQSYNIREATLNKKVINREREK